MDDLAPDALALMQPMLGPLARPPVEVDAVNPDYPDQTFDSFMIGAGASPKLVAQRLGHSNPSITLGVYSHVMPGHDQVAADAYAAALASCDQTVTTETGAKA